MSLPALPLELHHKIRGHLSSRELFSLCLACRELHSVYVSFLYDTIDLAAYTVDEYTGNKRRAEPGNSHDRLQRAQSTGHKALHRRQKAFLAALRKRPELASSVRVLRWSTVFDSSWLLNVETGKDDYWSIHKKRDLARRLDRATSEDCFNLCNDALWSAFSLMQNVKTVELNFVSNERSREETPPPPLFTSARSVTLSGIASRFLIKSILRGVEPSGLQHLHLNNLQEYAEVDYIPQDWPLCKKSNMALRPSLEIGESGPMRTHLSEFHGRWPNLQSLIIDTSSGRQIHHETRQDRCRYYSLDDATEEQRYSEIGAFLRSVSPRLRYLRFEQGRPAPGDLPSKQSLCNVGLWRYVMEQRKQRIVWCPPEPEDTQPNDVRFAKHILPAILEGSWPRIEAVEMYGVGDSSYIATQGPDKERVLFKKPLDDKTLGRIQLAMTRTRRLVVEPEATRFFWMSDDSYGTGIPQRAPEADQSGDEEQGKSPFPS